MRLLILLAFIALLAACASSGISTPTTPPKYQLTLSGDIDGAPFQGVALGSTAASHEITITSSVDINMFTAQSCHRSSTFEDVIKVGWLTPNRSYSFRYDESPGIEDTGDCILRLCAFSKTVGAAPVSCAAVDFKSPRYVLPAENICDGFDGQASGTMLCHTKAGLTERARFKTPVVMAPQAPGSPCSTGHFVDADQTTFEYQMPPQECVFIFMEKAAPHRRAKLTAIPYDLPLYSGGN